MQKKLTITIDIEVYFGLRTVNKQGEIYRFAEDLVRPHVIRHELESAYEAMTHDTASEEEAVEWTEAVIGDSFHEKR